LIARISPYSDLSFDNKIEFSSKSTYLYLTPKRLVEVCKGSWMNVNSNIISKIRFEHISVDDESLNNNLFFFRNLEDFIASGEDPLEYIKQISKNGTIAVVVDNLDIARKASIPAFYVKDVSDALADAGRAARNEINSKVIAVIGSTGKTTTKLLIKDILINQAQVHAYDYKGNKTPHIMTSLANLRLTDNIEVNEIAIDNRPNPARFRMRSVFPDICLVTNLIFDDNTIDDILDSYAITAHGIKDGGLYIINSDSKYLDRFLDAIQNEKEIAIQTYGTKDDDVAKLVDSSFDLNSKFWNVKADILGKIIEYKIKGSDKYLPISSIGVLLTLDNLGYDIEELDTQFLV
jgi:UDP-N-acetylmuramoyl-tripeptide--D-alanyl-D-alanine ligase